MRTKDSILLEQAYAKVHEANATALRLRNKPRINKDPEILRQMFQYLSTKAEYFASVHSLAFGEQDWSREKSKTKPLTNGTLQDILTQVPPAVKELADQGYDWTRVFISTDKVHNFQDDNVGKRAQMADITNTITLIHNQSHILIRCYDPFEAVGSKELKVDKETGTNIHNALLKAESLFASLYGVQQ